MTTTLGFISVRQHAEHGYFGGYLIVNQLARPLEFHCTLPVKPSRAQAVLYGPTIDDFVCGEQICKALVNKAKVKPQILITDCSAAMAFANVGNIPIGLIHCSEGKAEQGADATSKRVQNHAASVAGGTIAPSTARSANGGENAGLRVPASQRADWKQLQAQAENLAFPSETSFSQGELDAILSQLSSHFELSEPLQRIQDALLEAHPTAKAA